MNLRKKLVGLLLATGFVGLTTSACSSNAPEEKPAATGSSASKKPESASAPSKTSASASSSPNKPEQSPTELKPSASAKTPASASAESKPPTAPNKPGQSPTEPKPSASAKTPASASAESKPPTAPNKPTASTKPEQKNVSASPKPMTTKSVPAKSGTKKPAPSKPPVKRHIQFHTTRKYTPAELRDIDTYINILKTSRSWETRANAAIRLSMFAHPKALTQLHLSLVGDIHEQARINSANAIARINDPSSTPLLMNALRRNKGKVDVQIAIVRAFGDMRGHSREVVPKIKYLMRSDSPIVREAIVEALWKINEPSTHKYIIKMLEKEQAQNVRATLLNIIADLKSPESMLILEDMVNNPLEKPEAKDMAIRALNKLKDMGIKAPPRKKKKTEKK